MLIRHLQLDDVAAIVDIEICSASAWSNVAIIAELHRKQGIQLVALGDTESSMLGWCCAMVVEGEAELLKIGVAPQFRRTGVATALLYQLEIACRQQQVHTVFLEVRAQNSSARVLYDKSGFSELSRRRNYYRDPKDDAVVYVKRI